MPSVERSNVPGVSLSTTGSYWETEAQAPDRESDLGAAMCTNILKEVLGAFERVSHSSLLRAGESGCPERVDIKMAPGHTRMLFGSHWGEEGEAELDSHSTLTGRCHLCRTR